MKRHAIHGIFLAFVAVAMMTSCQRDGGRARHPKDTISVVVDNAELTKAGLAGSHEIFNIPVETEDGDTLVLTALISDFDTQAPSTKGVVLTSSNIAERIGSTGFNLSVFKDGAVYAYDSYDTDYKHIDGRSMGNVTVTYGSSSWELNGGPYFWPVDEGNLTFCSYVPSSSLSAINWNKGAKASFHLAQQHNTKGYNDAVNQDDILFGIKTQNTAQSTSVHINFKHALTAVKFVRGNIKGCTISNISLENFYAAGDGEFSEDGGFVWKNHSDKVSFKQDFYTELSDDETGTISLDGSADGSKTFMIIPQVLSEDAVFKIEIEGRIHPIEFKIGKSTVKDWSIYAGKVLTFKVSTPSDNYTGVTIEVGSTDDATVATNATVSNTNYSDVYIRANVVANWVDANGIIMAPILGSELAFEFAANFSDFWFYDADSETYYYKYPVPEGEATACNLFERYARPATPDLSKHELPADGRIELVIVSQAIEADPDKAKVTAAGWNAAAIAWMSSTRKN
ncbi:MAG: fimbrillin family protein [Bacteroidales bacterium]|nr:fimbrillin family protein [Bacteroidales bacterium]